ncbi:COF family HAD hydrolase protein, partial [Mycoplasmopsis synoviae]
MPLNISKGQTLLDISKDINLSLENALAIGDQENDIEMLKNVAYPVAMLNAKKELKKIAW